MWRVCLISFIALLMITSSSGLSASISPDIKYNGHEYKLFNDGMTWQQARSYCESIGGHLMTITSQNEQEIAETLLRTRGVKNNYWLGGYRNGNTYIWITGEEFNYSHWALGEPNNAFGREYIVSMYKNRNPVTNSNNSGDWNDISDDGSCNNEPFFGSHNFGFICEWDTNVAIERDSYRDINDKSIIDGIYSIQPQCAPDKELSVENNSTNWGANVIIDNISSNFNKWKIQRIANTDYYSIIAVHSNLALDVANARAENGVNISTWPYLGGSQNQFKILYAGNGYYTIQANIGGNFVVDVFYAENRAGTNVWSYGFNGTPAQLWKFVPIKSLPVFQSYSKRATQKVTAYVMPDLQARAGDEYVSRGDNVTVLREEGDAIFVRYPVSGGTKERWVNKNDIFNEVEIKSNIGNIQYSPSGLVYPLGSKHRFTGADNNNKGKNHDHNRNCCNNGGYGIKVYAITDGEVRYYSTIGYTPNSNNSKVLVSYGNVAYFVGYNKFGAVYAHLSAFEGETTPYGGKSNYPAYSSQCWGIENKQIGMPRQVKAGDIIGYIGESGNAKGAHLHFELYSNAYFNSSGKVSGTRLEPNDYFNR